MAEELVGNVLVGQSGGPTSVINASVAGVIAESLNHAAIEEIYGSLNGVLGILHEDFIDLAGQSQQAIRALRHTPGAALDACRVAMADLVEARRVLAFLYQLMGELEQGVPERERLVREGITTREELLRVTRD